MTSPAQPTPEGRDRNWRCAERHTPRHVCSPIHHEGSRLELFATTRPRPCDFKKLAATAYSVLTFHRVIKDFMIQGASAGTVTGGRLRVRRRYQRHKSSAARGDAHAGPEKKRPQFFMSRDAPVAGLQHTCSARCRRDWVVARRERAEQGPTVRSRPIMIASIEFFDCGLLQRCAPRRPTARPRAWTLPSHRPRLAGADRFLRSSSGHFDRPGLRRLEDPGAAFTAASSGRGGRRPVLRATYPDRAR